MAKILITGGTGLIGKHLSSYLTGLGHKVVLLSRRPHAHISNCEVFEWNVETGFINEKAFDGVEHIIHLAGEGIADKRWTKLRKQAIIDSRIKSSALIASYVEKLNCKLKSFVGASAIGIYGAVTSDKIFEEADNSANDFLGTVCRLWESSYVPFQKMGINTNIVRLGNVLATDGGAYPKIAAPFNYGFGSALGTGKQFMPWIHINDLVRVLEAAIFLKLPGGIYNAVASEHITNFQFSKQLAKSLHKPFFMPKVPEFILKLMLGEMACIILNGSRVSNQKLIKQGFRFDFNQLSPALDDLASGRGLK